MVKKNKLIENIDDKVWRQFVGLCKFNGISVGEALTKILKQHIMKIRGDNGII